MRKRIISFGLAALILCSSLLTPYKVKATGLETVYLGEWLYAIFCASGYAYTDDNVLQSPAFSKNIYDFTGDVATGIKDYLHNNVSDPFCKFASSVWDEVDAKTNNGLSALADNGNFLRVYFDANAALYDSIASTIQDRVNQAFQFGTTVADADDIDINFDFGYAVANYCSFRARWGDTRFVFALPANGVAHYYQRQNSSDTIMYHIFAPIGFYLLTLNSSNVLLDSTYIKVGGNGYAHVVSDYLAVDVTSFSNNWVRANTISDLNDLDAQWIAQRQPDAQAEIDAALRAWYVSMAGAQNNTLPSVVPSSQLPSDPNSEHDNKYKKPGAFLPVAGLAAAIALLLHNKDNILNGIKNWLDKIGDLAEWFRNWLGNNTDIGIEPPVPDPSGDPETGGQTGSSEDPLSGNGNVSDRNQFKAIGLEQVFPFCIPWDIYHLFTSLRATREAPKFTMHLKSNQFNFDHSLTVDMQRFDQAAAILRIMLLILYIMGLLVGTRYLIGAT